MQVFRWLCIAKSARGGWKSGSVGLLWCRNVIALVCNRNCIATDISEADGWCVYIIDWIVCPSKSTMSTWMCVGTIPWKMSKFPVGRCGSVGLRIEIWKTLQDGGGVGGV